jgi:protein-S-isoprenylcysteine O-methyltransferase Ste14
MASLIIGAALFVAAPLAFRNLDMAWSRSAEEAMRQVWMARLFVSIGLFSGAVSVVLGIQGIRSSIQHGRPIGISVGGLVISSAAFALWVITEIEMLFATERHLLEIMR